MRKLDHGTPTAQWAAERIRELEYVLRAMERMATHCDQGQYIDYAGARTIFEDARELLEQAR